ncbi:unnamed protein product [Phytomonas sp. EM1]|nr:unnamed protein product [Phytomonas sp. EM1]|eukprot:CCW60713.1 unnamed protein product [Phytomonas sp. isolate EM1]
MDCIASSTLQRAKMVIKTVRTFLGKPQRCLKEPPKEGNILQYTHLVLTYFFTFGECGSSIEGFMESINRVPLVSAIFRAEDNADVAWGG